MKLLYLGSTLLATAAIAHTQVLIIAAIEFAIEIIEDLTAAEIVVDIGSEIELSSELTGQSVLFTAETIWAHGMEFTDAEVIEFSARDNLVMDSIYPVSRESGDELFLANLEWNQVVQAFGRDITVEFSTDISSEVSVDAEGVATFRVDGVINGPLATVRVSTPGYTARWIDNSGSILFGPAN